MNKNIKAAVVVSRFNQGITQSLLEGSLRVFKKHGIAESSVKVVWVPGAFEIPLAALKLARSKKYAAVVCLGCVLKGETDHNKYIAEAAAQGIMDVSLQTGIPIAFGILTPDSLEQARERSGNGSANKGEESAEAVLEMVRTLSEVR